MGFRDRFFTPRVARAMMSPLGIVLAGAGAALGIVTGLGIPAAVAFAVVGWGGRVAVAISRSDKGPDIDAYALVDPWRRFVLHAQSARNRFNQTVRGTRSGPIRERLTSIGARIDEGVEDIWKVANRGQELARARAQLDPTMAAAELARTEAEWARTRTPHLAATIESLRTQLALAARMQGTVVEAEQQLRLLDARLDEAVARTIELSVGTGDEASLSGLASDVGDIVGELEALRLALDDANAASAAGAPLSVDLPAELAGDQAPRRAAPPSRQLGDEQPGGTTATGSAGG